MGSKLILIPLLVFSLVMAAESSVSRYQPSTHELDTKIFVTKKQITQLQSQIATVKTEIEVVKKDMLLAGNAQPWVNQSYQRSVERARAEYYRRLRAQCDYNIRLYRHNIIINPRNEYYRYKLDEWYRICGVRR